MYGVDGAQGLEADDFGLVPLQLVVDQTSVAHRLEEAAIVAVLELPAR